MIRAFAERWRFARYCVLHTRSLAVQKAWQEKHLRALLVHAYEHVPLWKSLLDERGVTPNDIRFLEDIRKIPVTSKHTFMGRMVEEFIDSSRPIQAFWYVTSGTSGTPFRFIMSEMAMQDKYADMASLRFLWWRGLSVRHLATINLARIKIRGPNHKHRMFVPVEDYLRDPKGTLAHIAAFKPYVLSAYPSILFDIATVVAQEPQMPFPMAPFILSFGEMLTPSVREFVSHTLKSEVYDRYGLEEIGVIGVECAQHDGFHINTESVLIEIVDETYAPVPTGKEGRILATDLFNTGMPFIRYDTGDRGRISYEPCPCGIRSPRIWIDGRYTAYLDFGERRIHHLEFDGAMDGFMNYVFQYQIVKKGDHRILARIVPGPAYSSATHDAIRTSLTRLVGSAVKVDVEPTSKLPLTPRGKSKIVMDESAQG